MIIKGLEAITAKQDADEGDYYERQWDGFIGGIQDFWNKSGVEGIDHIEAYWYEESCMLHIMHFDSDHKFVAVMGMDDNSQRAWAEAEDYVSESGLTYQQLADNSKILNERWKSHEGDK